MSDKSEKVNISVINHEEYLIFVFMQKAKAHITVYCSCAESHWFPCDPNEPVEASAYHSDMQCFCTHEPENTHQSHLQLLEKNNRVSKLEPALGLNILKSPTCTWMMQVLCYKVANIMLRCSAKNDKMTHTSEWWVKCLSCNHSFSEVQLTFKPVYDFYVISFSSFNK